jgi:cardiolipin synthase
MFMRVKKSIVALVTFFATVVGCLLVLNFSPGEKKIDTQLTRLYDTDDPQFRRSLGVLLGPPIVDGNKVDVLLNGDQIFPAMLKAIREAKQTIDFETYIYWSGDIGRQFTDALAERARAGVKVNVMLDWIGSMKITDDEMNAMRSAGVQLYRYHKPAWWKLARLNNRTHRKLLIVDGRIGFTGGVGIADKWGGHAQDPDHWRDTHFRVEGPVVGQMQAVFNDNWTQASGQVLDGDAYFPPLKPQGNSPAQMFSSSPTGGSESMHLMYLMAITAARHSIHLSNSYFVPDKLAVRALIAAAKRGVEVRIIVPGPHIDSDVVRAASHSLWGDLLKAGVKIAEYQPTMFHVKALVVDSLLVSVGSTNFDNRSFILNDEANLNMLDAAFAKQQEAIFEDDWKHARPYSLQKWEERSYADKLADQAADLIGAQL